MINRRPFAEQPLSLYGRPLMRSTLTREHEWCVLATSGSEPVNVRIHEIVNGAPIAAGSPALATDVVANPESSAIR